MALTDDDLHRLAEIIEANRAHACPLTEPEAREKHERHHNYIDVVMQRESERTAVRRAVIEKSLAGLVWSGMVAFGAAIWTYMKDHLK